MNSPADHVLPVLADMYDGIESGIRNTSIVNFDAGAKGAVDKDAPGFAELRRRLALELTQLPIRMLREHEHDAVSVKYYIDTGDAMIRSIDDKFGPIEQFLHAPFDQLQSHTRQPLPDYSEQVERYQSRPRQTSPAGEPPTIPTALELITGEGNRSVPQAGHLYLLHTSAGYIPCGVVATGTGYGSGVKLHFYRRLLDDPSDTTFYELIARNELLLPPLSVMDSRFTRNSFFSLLSSPTAPAPVSLDHYYVAEMADCWDPRMRGFTRQGFLDNPEINPTTTTPGAVQVTNADETEWRPAKPEDDLSDAWISPAMEITPATLAFAVEESLAYYGLIDTPRPTTESH